MLTQEKIAVLRRIDKDGFFTQEDKRLLPGLHFCPEWDDLPISDECPEKSCCVCDEPEQLEFDFDESPEYSDGPEFKGWQERSREELKCSTHPDAPALDRYVCDCEGWTPDE